jgi:coniferyl-aldehyde dehydrogenase
MEHRMTELRAAFEQMQRFSRSGSAPTFAERKDHLRRLRTALIEGRDEFAAAISHDFGTRSLRETAMLEVLPVLQTIGDAISHLRRWMGPERRAVQLHFLPARNSVVYQPKGVVLIIAPWNYPLQLALSPLVAALAAGNRVVLKPSELTARFSEVLKRRLESALGADRVLVATGGVDVATALTALPFDHILFTGSTAVGAKVMEAAAKNLVPVTLELGGKSPAVLHESCDLATAARRIARGKLMNAGQTCIAPDYVLVPDTRLEAFAGVYAEAARSMYPRLVANPDYTSIVAQHHYDRLVSLAADAKAKGAAVTIIDPAGELPAGEIGSSNARKIAPTLVTGARDDMKIMQEEIFGPLLPLVPYASLDDAIRYVHERPRPLALYYFDNDRARIRDVLARTVSGGVSVNDIILHAAQESLPFGGIGPSGMGAYHGEAGFRTFSHAKGVFRQGRLAGTELLAPPYGRRFDRMIGALTRWLGRG